MNKKFKLEPYNNKNLHNLFKWKNEKTTRYNSLNSRFIKMSEHKKWIKQNINSKKNKVYIFYYNKKPAGVCAIVKKKKFYYLNYSIDRKFRKRGFSKVMLSMFLKKIKAKFYKNKVFAIVLRKNFTSYRILSKFKFVLFNKSKNFFKMKMEF